MVFLRFCAVGAFNTVIGLSIIYGLMYFAHVQYVVANALGYAVGSIVSFTLNRSWTFSHRGSVLLSGMLWAVTLAIAYSANISTVMAVHEYFGLNVYVAQLLGIAVYATMSFLGGKFYAFRNTATARV